MEYSMGSDMDGITHIFGAIPTTPTTSTTSTGTRTRVSGSGTGTGSTTTTGMITIRCFVASLFILSHTGEFYLYSFIQPPSILPTSANGVDRAVSLLVSIAFSSHKSLIKNFSISNLVFSCFMVLSFSNFD